MLRPLMNRFIYFDPADTQVAARMQGLMRGLTVPKAARLAAEFVHRSIANTGKDSRFGVAFEGELGWLAEKCRMQNA